ncbi:MAG: PAS domain S-box protein, partial [Desulfobacterium sp.]|nr:PAS domain S-box protein [Desulfobacterium sp.]
YNMIKGAIFSGDDRPGYKIGSKVNRQINIAELDLASIINVEEIQSIMDDFCYLTHMTTAVLDLEGRVIETTGWQDICTKFHRTNPETARNCTESDLFLAKNLKPGEYVDYKCKNGLWDVVTPLYVGNKHLGNIYTGQFFYDDEQIDEEIFIKQAEMYGFDKVSYLQALRRVPRYSRKTVKHLMHFLVKFTTYVSGISLLNTKLEKEIQERRLAEKAHQESESFIKAVMDNLPIGVAVHSIEPPAVKFHYMNDNFPLFYRTTREELADPDAFWTSIYQDPDFREELRKRVLDGYASGDPAQLHWEDVPITRKGEETSFISAQNVPVPNKPLMISTVWDVTDRKLAEEALKEREKLLNEVGRIAKIGGWEMDLTTRMARWTKGTYDIVETGYDQPVPGPDEHIEYYLPQYRSLVADSMQALIEDDQLLDFEAQLRTAKGNMIWCRAIGRAIKKEGRCIKVYGTFQNITDRKKAEEEIRELNRDLELRVCQRTAQLEEANKELEDFVYSISHDLRAPLRSISGFAEIIDRRHKASLNEEGRHYFDNIVKASRQMDVLIDDLLRFSRLGRKAIKSENVSLADAFKTAIETLAEPIKKTDARVRLPEQMPVILGDSTLATHILINLLENAVKYHKPGVRPLIDISVEIEDRY